MGVKNREWPLPPKPVTQKIKFEAMNDGFFISRTDAEKLLNSVNEWKVYSQKLEILVEEMQNHYQ